MKLKKTSAILALTLATAHMSAIAGDPPSPNGSNDLVQLVGPLDPKFSVELTQEEIQSLADSVKDLQKLEPQNIDINSLFLPGDEGAIEKARQAIAKIFVSAARDLVDMKAMVYKLAALVKASTTGQFNPALYDAYLIKFQGTYNSLIQSLGQDSDSLLSSIQECKSEACVTMIASAQGELIAFGNQLNTGIQLKKLDKLTINWKFGDVLLKSTLEKTLDAFLQPNTPTNLYGSIFLAALTPFVAAGRASVNVGKTVLGFVANPTLTRLTIHANPVTMSSGKEASKLAKTVAVKINSIVNPAQTQRADRTNDPDFNSADPHRVSVLICDPSDSSYQTAGPRGLINGYYGVFGVMHFTCTNARGGDSNRYRARILTVGPGAGAYYYSQEYGLHHAVSITITSPTPILPVGRWYGVSAGADAIIAPGQLGEFVGKSASVAHFAGYTIGLGAHAGISELKIELNN